MLGIRRICKTTTMEKVSVIIPVYNVEKYLTKCLVSVINQTYSNLEIILVDDGSTDSSGKICDEFAEKDARIHVIHKENMGLSSARNEALVISTGEYICFVDSDDFICENLIAESIAKLEETDSDVCMFSHFTTDGKSETIQYLPLEKNVYEKEDIRKSVLPLFVGQKSAEERPLLGFVCRQVFRRRVIGVQRFKSEREYYAEDIVFDLEFYLKANRMCVVNKPLYYYRYVETSLSNRYRKNLFEKLIKLLAFKREIVDTHNIMDCEERLVRSAFRAAIGGALNIKRAQELSRLEKKAELKKIVCNSLVRDAIKKVKPKGIREIAFVVLLKLKCTGMLLALI